MAGIALVGLAAVALQVQIGLPQRRKFYLREVGKVTAGHRQFLEADSLSPTWKRAILESRYDGEGPFQDHGEMSHNGPLASVMYQAVLHGPETYVGCLLLGSPQNALLIQRQTAGNPYCQY
jgi:hypothetical protein